MAVVGLTVSTCVPAPRIVTIALGPVLHPDREQGLVPSHWEPAHAAAFVLNFVALAVVGPIVEELTFRGLGFSLLQRFGTPVAIVGIGLAFGAWHGLIQALPILALESPGAPALLQLNPDFTHWDRSSIWSGCSFSLGGILRSSECRTARISAL